MWISARTALTLIAAASALVVVAVAAPLMPRPHLPSLPTERPAQPDKFGAALATLDAPERVRAQRMLVGAPPILNSARWAARTGTGPAATPSEDAVRRLVVLLKDARTLSDPRAARAEPAYVVRLVRGQRRVDVMLDPAHDRLVVALDGKPVGAFAAPALHREYAALGESLFP